MKKYPLPTIKLFQIIIKFCLHSYEVPMKKSFNTLKSTFGNIFFGLKLTVASSPAMTAAMFAVYSAESFVPVLTAFAMKEIINAILTGRGYGSVLAWAVFFIAASLFGKLMNSLSDITWTALEQKTMHHFDNILIDKIIASDLSFFDSAKDNDILKIVRENQWILANIVWRTIWIAASCVSLAATLGILVTLSPVLALITALCVIPEIMLSRQYSYFLWEYDWDKSNEYRRMNYYSSVLRRKDTAEELRLYNNSGYFMDRYFEMWRSWFREKNRYGIRHNFKMFAANLLRTASIALIFVYSLLRCTVGKLGIGDIQYYISIAEQIASGLSAIFSSASSIQVDSDKITVIRNFIDWQPVVQRQGSRKPMPNPEIEFRHVTFRYPNTERNVLEDCSFILRPKEKTAFVGLNGAGKSTIVKLLLRFYDPDEGEILIDGINAKEYELKSLRKIFAAQFQEFVTYSMSADENVAIGDIGHPSPERVREALAFSGADEFVDRLENRGNTQITRLFDEKGVELSGGQKQKLALSRACYRNADIIILDEPSAALDPEAEHAVFEKFTKLWKDKGAVLISLTGCQMLPCVTGSLSLTAAVLPKPEPTPSL